MDKKIKIAYCIPSLYYPSGMERVLALKANYFTEHFGYEIHIILTDGKDKEPYYKLHPSITIHQLDINYDHYTDARYSHGFLNTAPSNGYSRKG